MSKLMKVFLIIVLCLAVAFIAVTATTFLLMGKYLEQYNDWREE